MTRAFCFLVPLDHLDGTWVVFTPPTAATSPQNRGYSAAYLDSLDFDAPRYLTLSTASYTNETLAASAVFNVMTYDQNQGRSVDPVDSAGEGRAWRAFYRK